MKAEIPPEDRSASTTKPRFVIALTIFAGLGALLLALIVAWNIWYRINLYGDIAKLEQDLHTKGVPTSIPDLVETLPQVDDSENAALTYLNVFEVMDSIDPEHKRLYDLWDAYGELPQGAVLDHQYGTQLAEYFEALQPTVQALISASLFDLSRFPIHLEDHPDHNLSHLKGVRAAARLLILWNHAAIMEVDSSRVVPSQTAILRLADSIHTEPTTISQLVRSVVVEMAVEELARSANQIELADADLAALLQLYAVNRTDDSLKWATLGRYCGAMHMLELLRQGKPDWDRMNEDLESLRRVSYLPFTGRRFDDYRYVLLAQLSRAIDMSEKEWPERLHVFNQIDDAIYSLSSRHNELKVLIHYSASLTHQLIREETDTRLATTMLAIERFHRSNQRLPESLDELAPQFLEAVPQDPMLDQAITYEPDESGYLIYSVYGDQDDDGGRHVDPTGDDGDRAIRVDWSNRN